MPRHEYEQSALLLRAILALGRRLRASRLPGTRTLPGLGVLGTLYRLGPLVATQLAAEEGLRPQSLTRMLAELERDRLISRKQSSSDGRAVIITLTARGKNKLLNEIAERQSWLNAAMSVTLTPDERQTAQSAAIVMLKLATYDSLEGSAMTTQMQTKVAPAVADKDLSRTSYTNVNLDSATFTDVNLKSAVFSDINLSGATFENVNLANASIRNADLKGMTINGIPVADLLGASSDRHRARGASDERKVESAESTTVFHVSDLEKALEFYTRTLGFEVDFRFGKPETYAGLSWKSVHLHLSSSYPYKDNTGHGNIYIHCGEIDRLYERLKSAGVGFYSHICERAYGMRDFSIKDPDGNQIGFGAAMTNESIGS